jgi:hypothetical protein
LNAVPAAGRREAPPAAGPALQTLPVIGPRMTPRLLGTKSGATTCAWRARGPSLPNISRPRGGLDEARGHEHLRAFSRRDHGTMAQAASTRLALPKVWGCRTQSGGLLRQQRRELRCPCAIPQRGRGAMRGIVERAERYRRHAGQLRVMARDPHDRETLTKLCDLARDYERMAEDLEKANARAPLKLLQR